MRFVKPFITEVKTAFDNDYPCGILSYPGVFKIVRYES